MHDYKKLQVQLSKIILSRKYKTEKEVDMNNIEGKDGNVKEKRRKNHIIGSISKMESHTVTMATWG